MCGIVGYVGAQQAAPILLEGLQPAGVPGLRLGRRRGARQQRACEVAQGGGRVRDLAAGAAQGGSPARPASATPAGPPTARRATSTPTRTSTRRAASPSCTTASSTTPPRCAPGSTAEGVELRLRDRHRGARPPDRPRSEARRRWRTRCATALAPGRGHLRHRGHGRRAARTGSSSPATAARSCSASARRRCSSPPTWPRWSATPAGGRTSTTASWPRSRADGFRTFASDARGHRASSRRPSTGEAADVRHRRLRALHAQGDPRAARRRRAARCAAGSTSASAPPTSAASTWTPRETARDPPGEDPRLRLGVLRRARSARSMIEELARIPADAEPASRVPLPQPGHRARHPLRRGQPVRRDRRHPRRRRRRSSARAAGSLGLVNVVGSAIARECDGGIYLHAGPEVSVASTKALTSHGRRPSRCSRCTSGRVRDLSPADGRRLIAGPARLPAQIEEILDARGRRSPRSRASSPTPPSLFFVGRVRGYPVAREGAQKLKEISYLHAEAYPASELKHGPLALIGPDAADRGDRPRRRAAGPEPRRRWARSAPAAAGCSSVGHRRPTAKLADDCDRRAQQRARAGPDPARRSRCSCWPTTPPWRWGATSTSRATWPRASRWSDPAPVSPGSSGL